MIYEFSMAWKTKFSPQDFCGPLRIPYLTIHFDTTPHPAPILKHFVQTVNHTITYEAYRMPVAPQFPSHGRPEKLTFLPQQFVRAIKNNINCLPISHPNKTKYHTRALVPDRSEGPALRIHSHARNPMIYESSMAWKGNFLPQDLCRPSRTP